MLLQRAFSLSRKCAPRCVLHVQADINTPIKTLQRNKLTLRHELRDLQPQAKSERTHTLHLTSGDLALDGPKEHVRPEHRNVVQGDGVGGPNTEELGESARRSGPFSILARVITEEALLPSVFFFGSNPFLSKKRRNRARSFS